MIYPNSKVTGVCLDRRAWDRGTERWYATTPKRRGVRAEKLYYGSSKAEAERIRIEWDESNAGRFLKSVGYNKKNSEKHEPKVWADWPATLPSWEKKQPTKIIVRV